MEQTKRKSALEAFVSTMAGFWASYFFWILVIAPIYNLPISHSMNFQITLWFTLLSLVRGYGIRRLFASGLWDKFTGKVMTYVRS